MNHYIGYHGTDKTSAERINKSNFSIPYGKIGWLGTGAYFFQENKGMAEYWAYTKVGMKPKGILRCEISIPKKKVFDATNPLSEENAFFHRVKEGIEKELKKQKVNVSVANEKDFDGKTYNLICKQKGYELVRAFTYTYQEEDRKNKTFSRVPNGVELCLRNPAYIVKKELIK